MNNHQIVLIFFLIDAFVLAIAVAISARQKRRPAGVATDPLDWHDEDRWARYVMRLAADGARAESQPAPEDPSDQSDSHPDSA